MSNKKYICELKNTDPILQGLTSSESILGFHQPFSIVRHFAHSIYAVFKDSSLTEIEKSNEYRAFLHPDIFKKKSYVFSRLGLMGIKLSFDNKGIPDIQINEKVYLDFKNIDELNFLDKFDILVYRSIYSLQIGNGIANLTDSSKVKNQTYKKISKFENTIYIPPVPSISFSSKSKGRVFSNIWNLKNNRYYYINLDPSKYDADYAANFLNSKYGVAQFAMLSTGMTIPNLTASNVQLIALPMLPLSSQKKVVDNLKMIKQIKQNLDSLPEDLYFCPTKFSFDDLLIDVDVLKYEELVKKDESISHELKSSLRYCLKTKKSEKYITHTCLKTVSAFLNSEGGTLLIGVRDNKTVCGIDHDEFKNIDEFERFLQDKIKENIGIQYLTFITVTFFTIDDRTVCKVECEKLPENDRCSLNDEIYIRIGPSSRKLNSKETADWIEGRLTK